MKSGGRPPFGTLENMQRNFIYILFLVVGLAIATTASSQDHSFKFRKIGLEDGLSNGLVNSLLQDSLGFIWIGTQSGLNRYDGNRLEPFLPGKAITDMHISPSGGFWIGTTKGLYHRPDPSQDFVLIPESEIDYIESLAQTHSGQLLVLATKRLMTVGSDLSVKTLLPLHDLYQPDLKSEIESGLLDLAVDAKGNIWLAAAELGVMCLHHDGKLERFPIPGVTKFILREEQVGMWAGTYYGLFKFDPNKKKFVSRNRIQGVQSESFIPADTGFRVFPGPHSTYLINSDEHSALTGYDYQGQRIFRWEHPELDFATVQTAFIDKNNLLWFGTTEGVVVIDAQPSPFLNHHPARQGSKPTQSASMRTITQGSSGELFMASYQGLFRFEPQGRKWKEIIHIVTKSNLEYPFNRCYDLMVEDTCLWCASETFGLFKLRFSDANLEQFTTNSTEILLLNNIHRLPSGEFWLGGNRGLFLKPVGAKKLVEAQVKGVDFSEMIFYAIRSDPKGMLWLATDHGLFQVDPHKKELLQQFNTQTKLALSHDQLRDIHQDKEGVWWLATLGGGLNRLDIAAQTVTVYTQKSHGLPNDQIISIQEDRQGNLWMGSYNGLIRFNKNTGAVRAFFESDGLTNSEFNHNSSFQDGEGRMYFGGVRGVNSFDPAEIDRASSADMLLTQLLQYDSDLGNLTDHTVEVQQHRKIDIGPANPFFVIHFGLADYFDPDKHQFAYRIVGIDQNWQDLGQQRMLRLGELPKGTYQLLVRGRGSNGVWSQPLTIDLVVREAFYKQLWFILLCSVGGTFLIATVFLWRIRSLKKRQLRLEEVVRARTAEISDQKANIEAQAEKLRSLDATKSRFFANISHELRTPLTLINGNLELLIEKQPEGSMKKALGQALESGHQLRNRVEEILDLSGLEAGKMTLKLQPVHLPTLLDRIVDTYRSYAEKKPLKIQLKLDWNLDSWHLVDVPKMEKIVQNLLSNAVKFTDAGGAIVLRISKTSENSQIDQVTIFVRDTGQGIHPQDVDHVFERYFQTNQADVPAMGGTGIGLALCKELTELMEGKISLVSEWGQGSTFTVELPLKPTKDLPVLKSKEQELPLEEDAADSKEEIKPQIELPQELEGKQVLIVEDHPHMREFIVKCLPSGWQITQAEDGVEALEKLEKQAIDLVVTDIMMPRMDGIELVRRINEIPDQKRPSMMVLSARAAVGDRLEALTIGIDDYLVKPFHPQELRVRMFNILKNRISRQQWRLDPAQPTESLPADQKWIKAAEKLVREKLDDTEYGVNDLAEALAVSSRTLTRRVREITGMTPLQFIREIRLMDARNLFEQRVRTTVAEVMYEVGFQSSGHFSRLYQERFGKKPSSYFE